MTTVKRQNQDCELSKMGIDDYFSLVHSSLRFFSTYFHITWVFCAKKHIYVLLTCEAQLSAVMRRFLSVLCVYPCEIEWGYSDICGGVRAKRANINRIKYVNILCFMLLPPYHRSSPSLRILRTQMATLPMDKLSSSQIIHMWASSLKLQSFNSSLIFSL